MLYDFKKVRPVVNEFEVAQEDIPTEELDEPETLKRKSKVLNDVKLKENSIVGSYYIKNLHKDSNCNSSETTRTAESNNDIVVVAKIEGTYATYLEMLRQKLKFMLHVK